MCYKKSNQRKNHTSIYGVVLLVCISVPFCGIGETVTTPVNVVGLTLYDKIRGGFSTDNKSPNKLLASDVFVPSLEMDVLVHETETNDVMVFPYELKVTAAPAGGGNNPQPAVTNFQVKEFGTSIYSLTTIGGSTTNAIVASGYGPVYNKPGYYDYNQWYDDTEGTANKPILYGADIPGCPTDYGKYANNTNILYINAHFVLVQYPLYDSGQGLQPDGNTNTVTFDIRATYYTNSTGTHPTNCWDDIAAANNEPHWSLTNQSTTSPTEP